MRKHHRSFRHTCPRDLVALSFCVATLPTLVACHGGGGGSPTVPSGVLDVDGEWAELESVAGGEPQGQCWADRLNSLAMAGAHGFGRMTVRQNGSAVMIKIAATLNPKEFKELTGTVGESSLTATETQGPPDFKGVCDNGERFDIRTASGQLSLSGSSTRLSGELVETLELMQGGGVVATVTAHFAVAADR